MERVREELTTQLKDMMFKYGLIEGKEALEERLRFNLHMLLLPVHDVYISRENFVEVTFMEIEGAPTLIVSLMFKYREQFNSLSLLFDMKTLHQESPGDLARAVENWKGTSLEEHFFRTKG